MKALFCVISVAALIMSGLEVIERGASPRFQVNKVYGFKG